MQEVFVCQICKEPINNFVYIERLSEDIGRWLPAGLSARFEEFNRWFLSNFNYRYDEGLEYHHMVRNSRGMGSVCLYCYVNEIFQWLVEWNKTIARQFRKLFSFGMRKSDFKEIIKAHAEPISGSGIMSEEFGVCDECGEYSDELRLVNGRWICTECGGD